MSDDHSLGGENCERRKKLLVTMMFFFWVVTPYALLNVDALCYEEALGRPSLRGAAARRPASTTSP